MGATAGQPIEPDGIGGPDDEPPPLPDAEIRQTAEILTAIAQLVTGARAMARGVDPGPVSPATQERQIAMAMPLARRIASLPIVRTWWAELGAFVLVSVYAGAEQVANGKPLDENARPTA